MTRRELFLATSAIAFCSGCVASPSPSPLPPIFSVVRAPACNLNQKTISASIQNCSVKRRGDCATVPVKIVVLDEKIFYYDSPWEKTATIFYPNQTVDALTDSNQNRKMYDQFRTAAKRRSTSIPLTSTAEGEDLTLQWSVRNPVPPFGWSGSGFTVKLHFPNCRTCEVTDYYEYEHAAFTGDSVTKRMVSQRCSMD